MKQLFFPLLFVFMICSCSKDNDDITEFSLSDITFSYDDRIDKIDLIYQHPSTIDKTKASVVWSTSDKSIEILNDRFVDAYFFLPETIEPKQVAITLTVSDGKNTGTVTKEILLPILSEVRKKGLGRTLDDRKSNNVAHDWYFDQMSSGVHSALNCGPSVAAMVVKWRYPDFTETPEDARKFIQPTGGGIIILHLSPYLFKNKVAHEFIGGHDIHILKEIINAGNIAILGVKMYNIALQENHKWHKGRFYASLPNADIGHFIIVKGYIVVDGVTYYEVYDPYSGGRRYADNGQLMGIDRYYQSNELEKALNEFIIYPTGNDMIVIFGEGS